MVLSLTRQSVIYFLLSSNHHDTQLNGLQTMRNYCELNVESSTPHDRSGVVMPHDIVGGILINSFVVNIVGYAN